MAEDNHCLREIIVRTLQQEGYEVLQACDGLDALAVADDYQGQIDLLITDIQMPRVDGHELARVIKKARPSIRILIVSTEKEADFPLGADYTQALLKPVPPAILLEKINELLTV